MNKKEELDIFKGLCPDDDLKKAMWLGVMSNCISEKLLLERFRKETGNNYTTPKSPIEKMVDESTGIEVDFLKAFAKWFNENIWGEDYL